MSNEATNEITKQIHEHNILMAQNSEYINSTVTVSLTVGFTGANLNGWITYNNEKFGKAEFHSTKITKHDWYFAGGGVVTDTFKVLLPEKLINEGTFKASGGVFGGTLMFFNAQGEQVFQCTLTLAGAGALYWSVEGDVHFTPCKE